MEFIQFKKSVLGSCYFKVQHYFKNFSFGVRVSYSSGWHHTCCIAEDDIEFLILLPLPP